MPRPKPRFPIQAIDLDYDGTLLAGGVRVPDAEVGRMVARLLPVHPRTTDIFMFAHGWQNRPKQADANARRIAAALADVDAVCYPELREFVPQLITVRWKSTSSYGPKGYTAIRNRAHDMAREGHAARILGTLLGYLHQQRPPRRPAPTLTTRDGRYLHCIGHSFGCRLIGEAIRWAAQSRAAVLGWPFRSDHPFTVDNFLALQMAAPPTIFQKEFGDLVTGAAPIRGPVVATMSCYDFALMVLHTLIEHVPGGGAVGMSDATTISLHKLTEPYRTEEFDKLTNIDANWRFIDGPVIVGAHSRIWYPETFHLLLSLVGLARG